MVLCDLNIPWPCNDYTEPTAQQLSKLKATLVFCASLRYTHVAINFILNQENIKNANGSNNKKQKSPAAAALPIGSSTTPQGSGSTALGPSKTSAKTGGLNPIDLTIFQNDPCLQNLQIYTRLTLCIEDTSNSVNLSRFSQHFDLISIQPLSEKAVLLATTQDIDLISFKFDEKLPCFLRHKLINSAVEKGIKFEIVYQPLFDATTSGGAGTAKKLFFQNTLSLIRASRNRGLIISSGAKESIQVKPMFDITNLLIVLGLDHNSCTRSMTDFPLKVILNGKLRLKSYKQLIVLSEATEGTTSNGGDETKRKLDSTNGGVLERAKKKAKTN